jgi:hypothetical protein
MQRDRSLQLGSAEPRQASASATRKPPPGGVSGSAGTSSDARFGNRNSNKRLIARGLFLDRIAMLIPIQ